MGSTIVVRSKIDEFATVEDKKLNISSDFHDALNKRVEKIVRRACLRARQNNRSTVMARDI